MKRAREEEKTKQEGEDGVVLYCRCKQPYDPNLPMIQCDFCEEWYHYPCVKLSEEQVRSIQFYSCYKCRRYGRIQYYHYDDDNEIETKHARRLTVLQQEQKQQQQQQRQQEQRQYATKPKVCMPRTEIVPEFELTKGDDFHFEDSQQNLSIQSVDMSILSDESDQTNDHRKTQLRYLNHLARSENAEFCELKDIVLDESEELYFVKLLVKWESLEHDEKEVKRDLPIGYFTYTKEKSVVCLRQIFIIGSERRKGYAGRLVSYFFEELSSRVHMIEKPNYHMCQLLQSYGYCQRWKKKLKDGKPKEKQAKKFVNSQINDLELESKQVQIFFRSNSKLHVFYPLRDLYFDLPKIPTQTPARKRRKLQ